MAEVRMNGSDSEEASSMIYDEEQREYYENTQKSARREQLYAMRERHIETLTRFFDEILDEQICNTFDIDELRVRKDRIQKHFNDLEETHVKYRQLCTLASNSVFVDIETRYMIIMSKLEKKIREQGGDESNEIYRTDVGANSSINPGATTIIRVETARLPQVGKFNGDPCDWPAFRDLFLAEVDSKDFDAVTKLLYLQEACTDKAKATLGPWQPTADNYKLAWEVMMAAYDDVYHVVHGIFAKMYAVTRPEKESYGSLRAVLDGLIGGNRQLKSIANKDVLWDQFLIHLGKQRLPRRTLDSWEQRRNQNSAMSLPTFDEFCKFLDSKSKGRREFEHETNWDTPNQGSNKQKNESGNGRFRPYDKNDRSKSYDRNDRFKRSDKNDRSKPYDRNASNRGDQSSRDKKEGTNEPVRSKKCAMPGCKDEHHIGACESFRKMSLTERNRVVREQRLCQQCLSPGHIAISCSRMRFACLKCPDSKVKHNYRLCPKTTMDQKPGGSTEKKEPATQ